MHVRLDEDDVCELFDKLPGFFSGPCEGEYRDAVTAFLGNILAAEFYRRRAEEIRDQILDDFSGSDDELHKMAFRLAFADLDGWLEGEDPDRGNSLFWRCAVGVCLKEFMGYFEDTVHLDSLGVETILESRETAQEYGLGGLTHEAAMERVFSDCALHNRIPQETGEWEEDVLEALNNDRVRVDLPDDWALVAMQDPFMARVAATARLEPFLEHFARIAAPAAVSPQLCHDASEALKKAADRLVADDPLRKKVLLFAKRIPREPLTDSHPIAYACLLQKFRRVLDVPSEYAAQKRLMGKLGVYAETLREATDKAAAVNQLTRAAALASAAVSLFAGLPESRLEFARRVREIGKSQTDEDE